MKVLSRLVKVLSLLSLTLSILVNIGLGIVIFYIVRIVKYGKKIAELKTTGTRVMATVTGIDTLNRSEEHTSELQSHSDLVCRLLLEKKKIQHQLRHAVERVAQQAARSSLTELVVTLRHSSLLCDLPAQAASKDINHLRSYDVAGRHR